MEACGRFAREWQSTLEEATTRPELAIHTRDCAECREALRRHEALSAALLRTGARRGPRAGWQARVLEAVGAQTGHPQFDRRRLARWTLGLSVGVVAAAALLWLRPRRSVPDGVEREALAIDWTVLPGAEPVRARSGDLHAAVGDTIVMDAQTGGAAQAEIRVFHSRGGIVFQCPPPGPGCTSQPGRISGRWVPPGPGTYEVFVVGGRPPLPPPQEDAAADSEAVLRAGAQVRSGRPIRVR